MGLLNDTPAQELLAERNRFDVRRRARHRSFQQTGGTPWVDIVNGVLGMIAEPIEAMKSDAMGQYYGEPSSGEVTKNLIGNIGGTGLAAMSGLRMMPEGILGANVGGKIAPGIRDEYARQGKMVAREAPVGLSGKEVGVPTPYSKGLKVPHSELVEMDEGLITETAPGMLDRFVTDIADLEGSTLIPFLGDRTSRETITHIGGMKLDNPITTQGGFGYAMADDPSVWASGPTVIGNLKSAIGRYENPIGVSMPMAGTGSDFSHHSIDVLGEIFKPGALSKSDNAKVTNRVNEFIAKANANIKKPENKLPKFKGLHSPDGMAQLGESKEMRKQFLAAIDNSDVRATKGAPDILQLRHSVHDASLRDMARGDTDPLVGQAFLRFPEGPLDVASNHRTYEMGLGGEYAGGLEHAVPRGLLMPDVYRSFEARGYTPNNYYKLFETGMNKKDAATRDEIFQVVTPEVIDNVSSYLELLKSRGQ